MSGAYRMGRAGALARLPTAERVAAYLVTRMPATYAASYTALNEVERRLNGREVTSVLDIGAGSGAASLAASHWFPAVERFTLIERDAALADAAAAFVPNAEIVRNDFNEKTMFPPHDLVIAAYSLGENAPGKLLFRLWEAARVALIVIEPGTPKGFAEVRDIGDRLMAAGAEMMAPCPGAGACPMRMPDWCHFAARIERSSLLRRLKGGELNYEDEKFSYIALARDGIELAPARIVGRPRHQPGLIVLQTCTPEGLKTVPIRKRERELFRAARQANWGDSFP